MSLCDLGWSKSSLYNNKLRKNCSLTSPKFVRHLIILHESSDAFDVGEDIGEQLCKLIGTVDHIDVITALFAFEVEVGGHYESVSNVPVSYLLCVAKHGLLPM